MSKTTTLDIILPVETPPEQIEKLVPHFAGMETVHHRLALLFQAAQGACLQKLQTEYGFTAGGDRKGSKPHACGFDNWEDLVKARFGFSDDKARRLMAVCDGMVTHLKKLSPKEKERLGDFLHRPMLHLPEPDIAVLEKITHKITNAQTQREFLLECRFIKQEPSAALADANPQRGKGQRLTQEEQLDLFVSDEIFGRFNEVEAIVKTWYRPLKVGQTRVPVWEHMTVAQKRTAESWLAKTLVKLADMHAQVKGALRS